MGYDYKKRIGISFYLKDGRIIIYRATLELIGFPEFFRFLYAPDKGKLAIEACGIDAEGAHTLPKLKYRTSCEMKSMLMVQLLYQNCGWRESASYRLLGNQAAGRNLVEFDLSAADIIDSEHKGRKS